jgi:hypothetical protein
MNGSRTVYLFTSETNAEVTEKNSHVCDVSNGDNSYWLYLCK